MSMFALAANSVVQSVAGFSLSLVTGFENIIYPVCFAVQTIACVGMILIDHFAGSYADSHNPPWYFLMSPPPPA